MRQSTEILPAHPRRLSFLEKRRNAAIEQAEAISPVTAADTCAKPLLRLATVTTAAQFCAMSAERKRDEQLENRTAHLLVREDEDGCEFRMVALGCRAPLAPEQITGLCWVDVRGKTALLVPENTIVYWK